MLNKIYKHILLPKKHEMINKNFYAQNILG